MPNDKVLEHLAETKRNREIVERIAPCSDPQHNPPQSGPVGSHNHYCPSCGAHDIYHIRSRPSI